MEYSASYTRRHPNMLNKIADLVEFDLDRFSPDQVIEDFNHKFSGSILKINDKYYKVDTARYKNGAVILYLYTQEGKEIIITQAHSIERVTPKTGLYASDNGLLYLYRMPKRQWIKSLSIGNNYRIEVLDTGVNGSIPVLWDTVLVDNPK